MSDANPARGTCDVETLRFRVASDGSRGRGVLFSAQPAARADANGDANGYAGRVP